MPTDTIPLVTEGLTFTSKTLRWNPDADAGDQFTVAPKCDEKSAPGQWMCTTHDEAFPHNWAMNSHVEDCPGACSIAWVCSMHGPEVP